MLCLNFHFPVSNRIILQHQRYVYTELTIELQKENEREKDDIYAKAEIMPQYPGGEWN